MLGRSTEGQGDSPEIRLMWHSREFRVMQCLEGGVWWHLPKDLQSPGCCFVVARGLLHAAVSRLQPGVTRKDTQVGNESIWKRGFRGSGAGIEGDGQECYKNTLYIQMKLSKNKKITCAAAR